VEMTERSANVLDELSPEEMDEFVGSDDPSPMRRYPAASDEIKLSVEEIRQALAGMPDDLSPEEAQEERIGRLGEALLVKREMTLVGSLVRIAMPDPTTEQREAMQGALGHVYRLGGMKLLTRTAVPMYAPVVKAAAAADARKSRWADKKPRDEIIDAELRAHPHAAPKRLLIEINTKLKEIGLKKASLPHLYERKKILGQTDEES
jgi:hypothetical protein